VEPYKHLLVSVIIGIIGLIITHDIAVLFLTIIFGSFVDFDHYFEFINTSGIKEAFSIKDFYSSKHFIESNKMVLIFHSWEYVFILFFITILINFDLMLLFISFGYTSHIIMDHFGNYDLSKSFYFLTVRMYLKFERTKLVKKKYLQVTGNDRKSVKINI
jgi:hypothetical protein